MRLAYGTVVARDLEGALHLYRMRLTTGQLSCWMPKLELIAGSCVSSHPLSLGTQVAALILNGEGLILGALNSVEFPAVSQADTLKRHVFSDGAVIEYDAESHQLNAVLPARATTHLVSDGGIVMDGDTTINGNLTVKGDASVSGNVMIGGNLALNGNGRVGGHFSISGVCAVGGLASVSGGAVAATGGMSMRGGDITVDGISFKMHTHPENGDGGGTTGAPQ